ncbi:MAG: bifunctional folylpolyglutamate synthase/dihydrofolate synthase [Ruminiclostridium sp.]|nr:bifunctional folylpolyglutamate synthase/dihydrofolate synthase [Ruminiclostridium sp.]
MNYNEAIDYIHGTYKFGLKLGLQNIAALLELMGNPQDKLKFVHVAGTNGKGSTVAFISSILAASGYRTGIYTSPYIQRFTERIKINDKEIGGEDLAKLTGFVRSKVDIMLARGDDHPTEFEIVTAIAFQYYYEQQCDVIVLEVGLGGRFDSTNIIKTPDLAVITTISYDHADRLGNTLPAIAFEKAGIIKQGGDVISYVQDTEVAGVFNKVCRENGSRLLFVDFSSIRLEKFHIGGQVFDYEEYKGLEISLLGDHQLKNAAVAVKAAELLMHKDYAITAESIRMGLRNARWPGRLEVLSTDPVFLIDGAHNIEGASVLRNTLDMYFPGKKMTFIMGVLKDKDYKAMIKAVIRDCHRVIAVTPENERALPAAELALAIGPYCKNVSVNDTIEEAVRECMETAMHDEIVCAFGSLYYIGAVRTAFGL